MRSYFSAFTAIGCVLLLAGCAGKQLSQAEQIEPTGSAFEQNLYTGYIALSRAEYNEGDYRDSDTFASRATQAAQGDGVTPEAIEARALPAAHVGELDAARAQLVAALDSGAADKKPVHAANAQVMFDCWMQEQEENRQPFDISQCREGFNAAVSELGSAIATMPRPKPVALPNSKQVRFVVYFKNNKADLTDEAQAVITEAKAAAKKTSGGIIKVSGNADSVGPRAYNQMLSEMRADAVAKVLAADRLPVKAVLTQAHGEAQPAVLTADEVSEPRNRRVEIIIEP